MTARDVSYESYQGAAEGEPVFCECGAEVERGGACLAVEPRDPARRGDTEGATT